MPAVVKSKSKLTRFHSQLGLAWRAEAGKRSMVPCGYLHGTGYIFCLSNHLLLTRSVTRMSRMFALISGCSGRSRTPPIEGAWLMNSLVLMAQCSRSSSARARPVSRPLLAAHKNLSQGRQPAMARQRLYARSRILKNRAASPRFNGSRGARQADGSSRKRHRPPGPPGAVSQSSRPEESEGQDWFTIIGEEAFSLGPGWVGLQKARSERVQRARRPTCIDSASRAVQEGRST